MAPFETIDQRDPGRGWVGPHIYDGEGELVWSGAEAAENWDVLDFRVSNVRGEDRMTFIAQKTGQAWIMDNTYQVREQIHIGSLGFDLNTHELHFIEDGTKAIVMMEGKMDSTEEQAHAVGVEGTCKGLFNGFKVLDTTTWDTVFKWSPYGKVGLEESTFTEGGVAGKCADVFGWDYIHANSVDKDQDGNYYVSGRHTDTIYKISKDDGRVIWRLNGGPGPLNDFDMGQPRLSFSRQHNVRFRGFNGTHEFISILDNAKGQDEQKATSENSRGLVIALRVTELPLQASIVSVIEHPLGHGHYAPRRGNYQVLDNKNVFMGWSEQATQSEHSPEGKLLMEATLETEWLGTYRSYKFPFKGYPKEPAAAHSAAYASESRNSTTTLVHVSQNGATEIKSWNMYKTTESGSPKIKVFAKEKTGFETSLAWDGYASYVIVEGIDKHGKILTSSGIVKTLLPGREDLSAAVAEELYWMQEVHGENAAWQGNDVYAASSRAIAGFSVIIFLFGAIVSAGLLVLVSRVRSRGGFSSFFKFHKYQPLVDQEVGGAGLMTVPMRRHFAKPSRDDSL